ncbi:tyrosine-type recombinase/integrase [Bacillus sp. FJAT-45037]|uniref:tyrosine-type recombinase/integrase n=1 Tax=Bacillus sp. FJAT-45037 TaxID=2011007 RepID=UPI0012FE3E8C|nr:tyrosine-type recombinase/integrase [Bacillus sp. FJAT-45037]
MELQEVMEKFRAEYRFHLAENSMKEYLATVRLMVERVGVPLEQIHGKEIRTWMRLLEEDGYQLSSIRRFLFQLNLFFQFCVEIGVVTQHPLRSIRFPGEKISIPYYLRPSQMNQLRKHVQGNPQERAVVELLYATGARLAELVAMNREDIQWSERTIHIPSGKGQRGRMVLFTRQCEEYLKAYLSLRRDDLPCVIANPRQRARISRRTIQSWFSRYKEELGFHMSPHVMRHTLAAHLAMKGMPIAGIKEILGHDNIRHTQLYARLYSEARKEQYDEWM